MGYPDRQGWDPTLLPAHHTLIFQTQYSYLNSNPVSITKQELCIEGVQALSSVGWAGDYGDTCPEWTHGAPRLERTPGL